MDTEYLDDGAHKMCDRCKCCEMTWRPCDYCDAEGVYGHDCGEDCCACLEPEDNVTCEWCEGDGGWWFCGCDEKGVHRCGQCNGEGHTSLTCPQLRSARDAEGRP